MGVLSRFFPPKVEKSRVLVRQIHNLHTCQAEHLGDRLLGAHAVMDATLDWLVPELMLDTDPETAARQICRELLSRVANATHRPGGPSAA